LKQKKNVFVKNFLISHPIETKKKNVIFSSQDVSFLSPETFDWNVWWNTKRRTSQEGLRYSKFSFQNNDVNGYALWINKFKYNSAHARHPPRDKHFNGALTHKGELYHTGITHFFSHCEGNAQILIVCVCGGGSGSTRRKSSQVEVFVDLKKKKKPTVHLIFIQGILFI